MKQEYNPVESDLFGWIKMRKNGSFHLVILFEEDRKTKQRSSWTTN